MKNANKKQLTNKEIEEIIEKKYFDKTDYTKRFIFESIKRYGNVYSYEKTDRVDNNLTKVIVTCPIHGDFEIDPYYFITNKYCKGCYMCNPSKTSKSNLKEFEKKFKKLFPHFSIIEGESVYVNNNTKIKLHCDIHNTDFYITPGNLLYGKCGCKQCNNAKIKETRRISEQNKLIRLLESTFSNYIFNDIVYVNQSTEVILHCKLHPTEVIKLTPSTIKRIIREKRELCPMCEQERHRLIRQFHFIDLAKKKHGDKYNYDNIYYEYENIPVKGIKCNKCGKIFSMYPQNFINGKGCPCISRSNGENQVENWLIKNNINFRDRVDISNSIIVGRTKTSGVEIDFIVDNYNGKTFWIEYNGEQHYTWCKTLHITLESFEGQLIRDKNVREYCSKNNIILIEIPWTYKTNHSVDNLLTKIIIENEPISIITQPEINYQRVKGKEDQDEK